MIFFCAVNDISNDSKFHNTVQLPSIKKEEIRWGITELSTSTFSKIKKDDYAFFYFNGKIIGIAKVLRTFIDKDLSKQLWGVNEHKIKGQIYWSNIVMFSTYHDVEFDFKEIIKLGNYSENFSVRRIIALNNEGLSNLQKVYGSEVDYVKYILKNYSKIRQRI